MARILSTERSEFINKEMQMYASNKVGQYSKFLNKNPIFVTYYSVNEAGTTTDVGTGAIDSEIGPNSPIKYNRIDEFPIYGLPELKPDVLYDETGYDIELNASDIIVLPNTVIPRSSDYVFVTIPNNDTSFLFRVNGFEHNTVQSKDFYIISLELKRVSVNANTEIEKQVVEGYMCIFENIGTQDKCLVTTDNVEKLETLYAFIDEITGAYKSMFFYNPVGNLAYRDNSDILFYDMYLSKFLTDTQVLYKPNSHDTLISSYDDVVPFNFDLMFNKTLWYTIVTKSTSFLENYIYCYASEFSKKVSPFKLNNEPCYSYKVFVSDTVVDPSSSAITYDFFEEYFPFQLISDIKAKTLTVGSSYVDTLIFNFVTSTVTTIDYDKLRVEIFNPSRKNLLYIPIIIYIIKDMIHSYFSKHEL